MPNDTNCKYCGRIAFRATWILFRIYVGLANTLFLIKPGIDRPCTLMETAYGLSHARFVAWNPAVKQDCSGLYPGYEYCVSIPNFKPTYTTPAPATYTEPAAAYLTASSSP